MTKDEKKELKDKTIEEIIKEMNRCYFCGLPYVICPLATPKLVSITKELDRRGIGDEETLRLSTKYIVDRVVKELTEQGMSDEEITTYLAVKHKIDRKTAMPIEEDKEEDKSVKIPIQ